MKNCIYRNLFSDIYTVHIKRFISTFDNIRNVMAFFESDAFMPFLQEILATEPRYITVLGLNGKYNLSEKSLEYLRNEERYHLLKSGLIHCAISFVIKGCCASITISSKMIPPKELRDKLKRF